MFASACDCLTSRCGSLPLFVFSRSARRDRKVPGTEHAREASGLWAGGAKGGELRPEHRGIHAAQVTARAGRP